MEYLFNHDEQNPVVIDNYPYGFKLRTQIRYWIESSKKGNRFCSQTMDPKKNKWNTPKCSTYSLIGIMTKDEKGYISWQGVSEYTEKDKVEEFVKQIGGESKLNPFQKKRYEDLTFKNMNEMPKYKFKTSDYGVEIRVDLTGGISQKQLADVIKDICKNPKNVEKIKTEFKEDGTVRLYVGKAYLGTLPKSLFEKLGVQLENTISIKKLVENKLVQ